MLLSSLFLVLPSKIGNKHQKMTLEWAHKQLVMKVRASFHFLYDTMGQWMMNWKDDLRTFPSTLCLIRSVNRFGDDVTINRLCSALWKQYVKSYIKNVSLGFTYGIIHTRFLLDTTMLNVLFITMCPVVDGAAVQGRLSPPGGDGERPTRPGLPLRRYRGLQYQLPPQ